MVGAELNRFTAERVVAEQPGSSGSCRAGRMDADDDVRLNMCAVVCFYRAVTIWLLRTAITQGYVMCGWSDSLGGMMLLVVVVMLLVVVNIWL